MRSLLALALLGACTLSVADAKVTGAACVKTLDAWAQCGGKSGCVGDKCGDQQYPGECCPLGYVCTRNDAWYWNCARDQGSALPPSNGSPPSNGGGGNQQQPPPQGPSTYKPDPPVAARKVNGEYDYGLPLGLSMLFYEAQRSGKLPANNRIKWRGDSGLDHKTADGRDVTGGWYDAGDNVKFNLPMAWSAHVLAWSLFEFPTGWKKAGQFEAGLDNLKWVTDYFIKSVGDGTNIVVQVGNGAQDHGVWGRPEDIKGPVPVYTVTAQNPGADVVGAMGAALGAASVVWAKIDPAYSQKLLAASEKAYKFASTHGGLYSNAVSDAASFYRSSNWRDDVALNAIWLYVRTGNAAFRDAALKFYKEHYALEDGKGVWDNYDWDSNSWAAVVLLSRFFPSEPLLRQRMDGFIQSWTKGSELVKYTPKGLAFSGPWGSLRHVGNAMFLLSAYANWPKAAISSAARSSIDCTVKRQLGYILGDTGRSFVVGYGANPPQRPHHRASSCPPLDQQCTWDYYNNQGPNPHTLYGALVGGPDGADGYTDDRNDFIKNEVATDYNAGFTGALAAASRGLKCGTAHSEPASPADEAPAELELPTTTSGTAEPAAPRTREAPALPAPVVVRPQPSAAAPEPEPTAAAPAAPDAGHDAAHPDLCFSWNPTLGLYVATTPEAEVFKQAGEAKAVAAAEERLHAEEAERRAAVAAARRARRAAAAAARAKAVAEAQAAEEAQAAAAAAAAAKAAPVTAAAKAASAPAKPATAPAKPATTPAKPATRAVAAAAAPVTRGAVTPARVSLRSGRNARTPADS